MTPRVSVVVPTFQERGHIRDCLSSLLAQDEPDFELLVVPGPDERVVEEDTARIGEISLAGGARTIRIAADAIEASASTLIPSTAASG